MSEEVVGVVQGRGAELAQWMAAARHLLLLSLPSPSAAASVSHVLCELLTCKEHLFGDENLAEFETEIAAGRERRGRGKEGVREKSGERGEGRRRGKEKEGK